MAKKTLSLSSLINSNMHKPKTKTGFTLYPKVAGYNGAVEAGDISTKAEADPVYRTQITKNYNSPTNIKRLFITTKHITVEYHAGPVIGGTSGNRWTQSETRDTESGLNLYEIAEKIATYEDDTHKYMMEKAINKGAVAPTQYSITGSFNVGSHPYACSNIEEIYFDWSVLLSSDVAPYFSDLLHGATPAQIAMKFANFNANFVEENNMPINLFAAQSAGGSKDLRKKYPRLREITFISNLEDLTTGGATIGFMKTPENENSGLAYKTWFELNETAIRNSNTCTLRGNMTGQVANPNKEFIVKSNMYVFDFDKLDAHVKSYVDKITTSLRQQKYGSTAEEPAEADAEGFEMIDIEKRLLEIETKYGQETMYSIWQYAFNGAGLPKSEVEKILRRITKPNRSRLAKKINIEV